MSAIKIERNVPIPNRYIWMEIISQMGVGDSIVLPTHQAELFRAAAKNQGMKCLKRKIDETTTRVWYVGNYEVKE